MTWKLPSHLEPYRDDIYTGRFKTVEEAYGYCNGLGIPSLLDYQLNLLQRLYDAGKLK